MPAGEMKGLGGRAREGDTPRIVFMAATAVYAVDLARVAEIIEPERWTGLPRRAPWVEGLLYHHGEALAIVNAGALLEETPTARGGASCVVRLNDATQRIGLLVDRVVGTWRKGSAEASRPGAPFVAGVWERGGRIVNLLDVGAVVERAAKIFEAQSSQEENPWPSGY